MQKINNICTELINICEINNKYLLIEKLQKIEPLLMRDVVTFKSLYID